MRFGFLQDRPLYLDLLGVALLGAIASFFSLGTPTLWNDEGLSFFASIDGVSAALASVRTDVHPPLYCLALALWLPLGESEFAVRGLSALATAGAPIFVYLATARLFGREAGLLAAVLFILNPTTIFWAQKARPYGLQTLFVAMAYWGFVRGFMASDLKQRWIGAGLRSTLGHGRWEPAATTDLACLTYILAGAAAILTQLPGGFFILGCNFAALWIILRQPSVSRTFFLNWCIGQIVLTLIFALWIPDMVQQFRLRLDPNDTFSNPADSLYNITPYGLYGFFENLLGLQTGYKYKKLSLGLFMLAFLRGAGHAFRRKPDSFPVAVILFSVVLTYVIGYFSLHSALGYVASVSPWLLVVYCSVIAYGVVSLPWPKVSLAFAVILLILSAGSLKIYYDNRHVRLDQVAQLISENIKDGDGFVLAKNMAARWGVAYYWRRLHAPVSDRYPTLSKNPLIKAREQTAGYPRLWFMIPQDVEPLIPLDSFNPGWTTRLDQTVANIRIVLIERAR